MINSKEKWLRNKEFMLLGKLRQIEFGQLNSKLLRIHGENLLLTSKKTHNLLPGLPKRRLKLNLASETWSTKLLISMRPLSEILLTTTTLSAINNANLRKMLKITSRKSKPSMLNTLRPGTTKWRTFILRKMLMVTGKSLLTIELKYLTTGMKLSTMILKPESNLRMNSLSTKDPSPLKKLLSEELLELLGHKNSKLSKKLPSNLMNLFTDQKIELNSNKMLPHNL